MRDFRLRNPGSAVRTEAERLDRAEATMVEWDVEEATTEYMAAVRFSSLTFAYASVFLILVLTLTVTIGLTSALVVLGVGAALTAVWLRGLRESLNARRRLKEVEREARSLASPRNSGDTV